MNMKSRKIRYINANKIENATDNIRLMKGDLLVRGFVKIENGDKVIYGKNHFVNQMLVTLVNWFATNNELYGMTESGIKIYLGTDTTTATTGAMTGLVSPIGTAPGTAPNTTSYTNANPSTNTYTATYTATWNAGTISGTVGEMGLYLNVFNTQTPIVNANNNGSYNYLASRLATGDSPSSFTAFTINTANALTITWTIQFVFA